MANMASIIMEGAGVGNNTSTDLYGNFDFSASAVEESSYVASAIAGLFCDIMEAEQSYKVADVIGAATIVRESRLGNTVDAVAIQEGIVKSGIERLKTAFQKFIAKIKEYYHRVINWFKAMFSNAEDFVKNYGDMIKKKAAKVKDFHYSGFKYTIEKGDGNCESIKDAVDKKIDSLAGAIGDLKSKSKTEFYEYVKTSVFGSKYGGAFKDDADRASSSDVVEEFISKEISVVKASDISELREELINSYRDGDDQKSDIKDFEGNSVDKMLKFLKESSKTISKFETELKKYENNVNKVIQKLNGLTAKDGDDKGDEIVNCASYVSSLVSAFLNLYKVPCDVRINIYKTISSEWLGALKKFYNFKGNVVKESTVVEDLEAYATLESSLVLEGEDCGSTDPSGDPKEKEPKGDTATTEATVAGILETAGNYLL